MWKIINRELLWDISFNDTTKEFKVAELYELEVKELLSKFKLYEVVLNPELENNVQEKLRFKEEDKKVFEDLIEYLNYIVEEKENNFKELKKILSDQTRYELSIKNKKDSLFWNSVWFKYVLDNMMDIIKKYNIKENKFENISFITTSIDIIDKEDKKIISDDINNLLKLFK